MNATFNRTTRRPAAMVGAGLFLAGLLAPTAPAIAQSAHEGHDHAAHAEPEAAEGSQPRPLVDPVGRNLPANTTHPDQVEDNAPSHGGQAVVLTPDQRARIGIESAIAGPGKLGREARLPGEIVFNEDRLVHLAPRVSGIARDVRKTLGDRVEAGEVLAVIESRELADAKSDYLASTGRAALAENRFDRERALRDKRVSSEEDYLEAEQTLAEARIKLRLAEQKLHTLGLSEQALVNLDNAPDQGFAQYEIRSPIDGVVTAKHIAQGESLAPDTDIFTVADTRSVWVNLAVYVSHLEVVRPGQVVSLRIDHSGEETEGRIVMVTPFVEASTRTATARVVLENLDGRWIPGTFATGIVRDHQEDVHLVIPRDAIQNLNGTSVVFVDHGEEFDAVPVTLGRTTRTHAEVLTGLQPGARVVTRGAFQLKAILATAGLDDHAGHGH